MRLLPNRIGAESPFWFRVIKNLYIPSAILPKPARYTSPYRGEDVVQRSGYPRMILAFHQAQGRVYRLVRAILDRDQHSPNSVISPV